MKRIATWIAGGSLAAALLLMTQPAPAQDDRTGAPTEVLPEAVGGALKFNQQIDFGIAEQGKKIDVDFAVENTSDKTINILDIKTGCGCTAKKDSNPTSIKPGETTSIGVEYNTEGKQGAQSRTITITTDDPAQETYRVSFRGNVVAPLFFSESMVNFGDLEQGEGATQEVSLISTVEGGVKIKGVSIEDKGLTVEQAGEKPYEKDGAKGTEYIFKITVPDDIPQSTFVTRLIVDVDKSDAYLPGLVVRGRIQGDLDFEPRRGAFAQIETGETAERTVTLRSTSDTPFKIVSIELQSRIEGNDVSADFTYDKAANATKQDVNITFKSEGKPQTRQADAIVTVQTEGKEKTSKMTFPVTIVYRQQTTRVIPNQPQPAISQSSQ